MRRPSLTYANVVATIALVLAIGGGTVYAAGKLGKNSVKSSNIAKGAVKNSDLGTNAVTSKKIKNGTILGADIAKGVIQGVVADVTGSASGGSGQLVNTPPATPIDVPLTGSTSFTPQAGQVAAIAAEAQFQVASTNPANDCRPAVSLFANGQSTRIFMSPDPTGPPFPTTLTTLIGYDADGPFGIINAGTPITITAKLRGDLDCTASSKLDRVEIRVIQLH